MVVIRSCGCYTRQVVESRPKDMIGLSSVTPHHQNGHPKRNWLAIKLQQWKEQPLPIKLGIAEVTTSILAVMAAVWALIFAVHQTRIATETLSVSLKAIKFQNAAVLLDPGNDVIERMRKKKEYVSVLKNESSDANTIAEVDAVLDTYQLQIFKASILKDNDLLPDTLWTTFVGEFCNFVSGAALFSGLVGKNERTRAIRVSISRV